MLKNQGNVLLYVVTETFAKFCRVAPGHYTIHRRVIVNSVNSQECFLEEIFSAPDNVAIDENTTDLIRRQKLVDLLKISVFLF